MDDIEEMPKPHFRPITYVKIPILWAFYYLNKEYSYEDAIRDIISKGGVVSANAAIVGGLIGASDGMKAFNIQQVASVLSIQQPADDIESSRGPRLAQYQPGCVISLQNDSVFHRMMSKAPTQLTVQWEN